jgi:hypothetical protein
VGAALVLVEITVAQAALSGPPIDVDLALVPAIDSAVGGRP